MIRYIFSMFLCEDIIVRIFCLLDIKDIKSFRCINKDFYRIFITHLNAIGIFKLQSLGYFNFNFNFIHDYYYIYTYLIKYNILKNNHFPLFILNKHIVHKNTVLFLYTNNHCYNIYNILIKCCEEGNLFLLYWFYNKEECDITTFTSLNLIDYAVEHNHLNIIKWLHTNGGNCSYRSVDISAKHGFMKILRWLNDNKPYGFDYINAMDYAAEYNHIDILSYLHSNGYKCTQMALNKAVENGHIDVVKFLYKYKKKSCNINQSIMLSNINKIKHIKILKYIYLTKIKNYFSTK